MLAQPELIDGFNRQVGHEFAASLQYVAIASYFDGQTLPQLGSFFYRQAEEERDHAMKFVKFIVEAGGTLRIPDLAAPQAEFGGAEEAVKLALASEERVTGQIYELVDLAKKGSNYIAQRFLDWFVTEQFEEVSSMEGLLQVVRRAGESGLLFVEEHLARGEALGAAAPPQ